MLQNREEVTKEVMKSFEKEEKSQDDEQIYAKKGNDDYEAQMDTNKDDIVTCKEYYEYCSKNNIKDMIKEYGLSENKVKIKTKGNIEKDA